MVVYQPRRGFRYGAEAFWMVGFGLEPGPVRTALDLGTGSGIGALLLGGRGVDTLGIDNRPEWSPGWSQSLAASQLPAVVQLERRDAVQPPTARFDLVICNPPYFSAAAGPVAPDPWKAAARTEGAASLADFVRAALDALEPGGRACFVFPVEREPEILGAARELGAHAARRVHVGRRRALVSLRAGEGSSPAPERLDEEAERVRQWYTLAGAPWRSR